MNKQSVFMSIVGRANVGKSSLTNLLIGEKIAIVSRKPQTTRNRITGVLTEGDTQFVIFDTPGFQLAKTKLSKYMNADVNTSISDVDVIVMIVEPFLEVFPLEERLIGNMRDRKTPVILIINKIDIIKDKDKIFPIIEMWNEIFPFAAIIPMSIQRGNKKDDLLKEAARFAKEGPHHFDEDTLTDQSEKTIVGEIIREKLLNFMHEEIPHGTGVIVETMKERKDKKIVDISAVIYTEKDSHKGMIIGKKGESLKRIASAARADIEKFLDTQVNLKLWVKVKEDWRNREQIIKSLGYGEIG